MRLSPAGGVPLAQASQLGMAVGGAEANVAAALAALGCPARMVSLLPDNPLGRMARSALAAAGVDTVSVGSAEGRMGLYFFEPARGPLPGRVTYDRTHSAFALAEPEGFDFDRALDGASLLHISGITPAFGPRGVELARAAISAARRNQVPICFDGNYRASLWASWDGEPRAVLGELVSAARVFIGNHRDISLLLGSEFSGDGEERRREAAEAAFDAFPALEVIASTARQIEAGSVHRLSARVDLRETAVQAEEVRMEGIVDRIGAGDAFAAGLLLCYCEGATLAEMAHSGLKLAVMKHGIPGDMITVARNELDRFDPISCDVHR